MSYIISQCYSSLCAHSYCCSLSTVHNLYTSTVQLQLSHEFHNVINLLQYCCCLLLFKNSTYNYAPTVDCGYVVTFHHISKLALFQINIYDI